MFTVQVSCVIDLPLEQAFAYVADFRNAPTWQPQLAAVRLDDGPFPEGSRVVEIHHFLGVRVEAAGDLVDWQPLEGFTVRGRSSLLQVESKYRFDREGDGTRVSLNLTMRPTGPARIAEPMLRRQLRRSLEESFARLPGSALAARSPT
ncbi:MAG TPA: SRPBCC family protein [Micromonosporaceae bacterium]|jgi:uncharacterized membrane protein|nr:SRPBCC family protein [Micromonosporaceae bacterium]